MKFTILKRLVLGNIVIMVIVITMGVYVALKLSQLNRMTHDIASIDASTIRLLEQVLGNLISQTGFEKKYLISKDGDFYLQFYKLNAMFYEYSADLEPLLNSVKKQELFSEIKKFYTRYVFLFNEEVGLINNSNEYSYQPLRMEREEIIEGINLLLRELIFLVRTDGDSKVFESNRARFRVMRVISITAGLTIFLGLLLSFLISRSIIRSLKLLKQKTREIASGRFLEIDNIVSPPEIKELADDFNTMSRKLNELDEIKLDFIYNISHELRTPLTAIKEASSMLLEKKIFDSPVRQQELLTITNEECERLIDTVNKILDFSRMEAKMMDYQFEEISIGSLMQRSILKFAAVAYRGNIDLELRPLPDLPPVILDEKRINQVLDNLLGNALKYTPRNGKIEVNISFISGDGQFILVSIFNTGAGIPIEEIDKIFDKFKRIDRGSDSTGGTGLGLSIVKHIIIAHGGKIWAQNEPGEGNTFLFTLPVS
ncbi:ATP-binding protein [Thermodesulfobacteriota bacterium]